MGDVLVELDVFLVLDFRARPRPERLGLVDWLIGVGIVGFGVLARSSEGYRKGYMVGILPDQGAYPVGLQELLLVRLQRQRDGCSPCFFLGRFQRIAAVAAGGPAHRLTVAGAGAPAEHLHLPGNDERGIEADSELADEGGVLPGLAVE